jgi:hypothetical protein
MYSQDSVRYDVPTGRTDSTPAYRDATDTRSRFGLAGDEHQERQPVCYLIIKALSAAYRRISNRADAARGF